MVAIGCGTVKITWKYWVSRTRIDDHPTIGREPAIGILGSGDLARIITDALVVTAITMFDVTTKRRGSTQLNGAHDATLCSA